MGGPADVSVTWQELARLPQLLGETRAGVDTLRPLVSTPAAASATGAPAASIAISVFGGLLVQFLADTIKAIDDDLAGMRRVTSNYERNEHSIASVMEHGGAALGISTDRPSQLVRTTLEVAALADDIVVPVAGAVTTVTNASQDAIRAGDATLQTGSQVSRTVIREAFGDVVGRPASDAIADVFTAPLDAASAVLRGVDAGVQVVEDAAVGAAAGSRELAARADRYLRVERPAPGGGGR